MSSKLPSILSATDEEIQLLLAAQCHIGTKNCDKQMEPYVFKRRVDGKSLCARVQRASLNLTTLSQRNSRHQHRKNLGEARVRCPHNRCRREPK